MRRYNTSIDSACCFCGADETLEHLFFLCEFSNVIVTTVMGKLGVEGGVQTLSQWIELFEAVAHKHIVRWYSCALLDFVLACMLSGRHETEGCLHIRYVILSFVVLEPSTC